MKTVLAVDDSVAMLSMVRRTLESGGFNVVTAEDGSQGLSKMTENEFCLVITDINMPVMDGITFIREIRKKDSDIPILTLTTEVDQKIKVNGMDAGANGWIAKPFRPAQFLDVVKQILT